MNPVREDTEHRPVDRDRRSVAIVGCGTVGTALGRLLVRAGYAVVGVSTTRKETARKAAALVGAEIYADTPWDVTSKAAVVFITTPDDAIEATCAAIARRQGFQEDAVVLHCSGALPSSVLASARDNRAFLASVHPLQSFASVEQAEQLLPGSFFSVEGDSEALPTARAIIRALGGKPIEIPPEGKTFYHAAAVVASNYLVTLMHMAESLAGQAGITPQVAFDALRPLVEGTLKNIAARGIPWALTGPIARGDINTVARHLKAMADRSPGLLQAYAALGRLTVALAQGKGTLSPEQAARLMSLLRLREQDDGR